MYSTLMQATAHGGGAGGGGGGLQEECKSLH